MDRNEVMSGKKLIFVTGVTGYVGCHLADTLLKQGHRVIALVRESGRRRSAEARAIAALEQVDADVQQWLGNLIVVPGDVQETADRLLGKIQARTGNQPLDEIWHCAATFLFRKRDRDMIEAINIEGVRHVLELVMSANEGQAPRYFHVGTAYSTGQLLERVPEAYVPGNTGFRSLYEWSKYEGETLVQQYQKECGLDATIFRPAIIVGSKDTKAVSHSAYYQVCDALYRLRKHFEKKWGAEFDGTLDVRLMGHPETRLNFVPIDFVIEGMLLVAQEESLATPQLKVFNIVNEDPPDMTTIHRMVCQTLDIRGLELVEEAVFENEPMNALERLLARSVAFQAPYMVRNIQFSTERFRQIVSFEKLPIPQVDEEFLATINQAYFDYLDSTESNGRR
jgi:nucleoside-diphosphate-sugar epimerase